MTFSLGLILDVTLVVLLGATIGYCVALHRRLGDLRAAQSELPRLIDSFVEATRRAEAGIADLKVASSGAAEEMGPRLNEAQVLREDLAFMIDHGTKLADRLEASVRVARAETVARQQQAMPAQAPAVTRRNGADGATSAGRGTQQPAPADYYDEDDDQPLKAERHPPAADAPAGRAPRSRAETTAAILRMLKGGD